MARSLNRSAKRQVDSATMNERILSKINVVDMTEGVAGPLRPCRWPNRLHQNRTVSWQISMPRSNRRSSTGRSDREYRTYIITVRRIISGERYGFFIRRRQRTASFTSSRFALTLPSGTMGQRRVSNGPFFREFTDYRLPLCALMIQVSEDSNSALSSIHFISLRPVSSGPAACPV
jgi:hypothetical protein